jgi:hypothetical protein
VFGSAVAERALAILRDHRSASRPRSGSAAPSARHEGATSRIRPTSHRAFGFHSRPLIGLVHICRSGLMIDLPR